MIINVTARAFLGQERPSTGFSLIELMITLAIVAIIATVAYPTYLNQVRKARRVEGKSLLLEVQGKQERFFTENNSYALNLSALGYGANNVVTEDGWYSVSSAPTGCAAGPAMPCSGFTLAAAPQNDQLNDTDCGSLGINNFGQKAISGTGAVQDCW